VTSTPTESVRELRRRAEEKFKAYESATQELISPEETIRLLHDLRVHQIELEMQNEALLSTKHALRDSLTRYFDLYDLAPVGYLALSEQGLIQEANLAAATMLGMERSSLVKQPISRIILKDDQDIYYLLRKQLVKTSKPQACDLRLVKMGGTSFWVHLAASTIHDTSTNSGQDADVAPMLRIVLSDITEAKRAEDALHKSESNLKIAYSQIQGSNIEFQAQNEEVQLQNQELERQWGIALQDRDLLKKFNEELEKQVAERTSNLSKTVDSLQVEIVERKTAEENVIRLNQLYTVLSETNQAMIRTKDRDTVFKNFCRIAVEHGGFKLAWVGLVDEISGELKTVTAHGATGYLDDIKITVSEEPAGLGPSGRSVREGTYNICNDFQGSSITRPWHEKGRAYDIHASASIALKEEGRVIGALTIYSDIKNFFDHQQVELLQKMGEDVSFALGNIIRENRRLEAE
jgi:PAS domain S-box-containing protein